MIPAGEFLMGTEEGTEIERPIVFAHGHPH